VNGESHAVNPVSGYVTIERTWKGDVIALDLPMQPVRLCHAGVVMNAGHVALKHRPLVYCVEELDDAGGRVQRFRLPRSDQRGFAAGSLWRGVAQGARGLRSKRRNAPNSARRLRHLRRNLAR